MEHRLKILCVGWQRTGTTSLWRALELLGVTDSHIGYSKDHLKSVAYGSKVKPMRRLLASESASDCPWSLLYKEVYEVLPATKFILTTRLNQDIWYDSFVRFGVTARSKKALYGSTSVAKDRALAVYNRHNMDVRAFMTVHNANFLDVCWEAGHGWKELCAFLGASLPTAEFPHINKSEKADDEQV